MRALILIAAFLLVCASGCSNAEKQPSTTEAQSTDYELAQNVTAKEHIETVCLVCHSPTQPPEGRIAPPLEIVKRNYLEQTGSREEFINTMVDFIIYPNAEQAKLHSDVEQYGIMDPVGFSEQDVRKIATYIYDNDLDKPDWLQN
jgi:uncharacterized membrane protein